jgi:hypothetical protein
MGGSVTKECKKNSKYLVMYYLLIGGKLRKILAILTGSE